MLNPWIQGRVRGAPVFPPLGAWQVRRKLASAGWVPEQWARQQLTGARAYWYEFPELVLTPGQTDLTRVTVNEDFWLVAVMGKASATVAGGSGSFRFQITEEQSAYKHSKYALNQPNSAPIAQEPGLQRIPHFIAAGSPVICKIQNLNGAANNTVNLCMFGYSTWWRV